MSQFESFPRSTVANNAPHETVIRSLGQHPAAEPRLYCAYNQTRQQFLCAHIELADFSPENLPEILVQLTPGSARALWLAPFRGIAQNPVDFPIDLVFLDRNNCVLSVVESFPISQPTSCNGPAGTALALPAQSVASTGTLAGDQLVLCSPEKMKRRFLNLNGLATGDAMGVSDLETEDLSSNPYSIAHYLLPIRKDHVQLTTWEEFLQQRPAHHALRSASPEVPEQTPPRTAELAKPAADSTRTPKNWLLCLLTPHRRDKRKSPREFLPWVAAYYFTGDTPAPASVRNISMNGMFVSTKERWYLGTIIHVTLTDWRLPSFARSITVNAMAVRWGDDGVGLQFVFHTPRRGRKLVAANVALVDVTQEQLKGFLQPFNAGSRRSALRHEA